MNVTFKKRSHISKLSLQHFSKVYTIKRMFAYFSKWYVPFIKKMIHRVFQFFLTYIQEMIKPRVRKIVNQVFEKY